MIITILINLSFIFNKFSMLLFLFLLLLLTSIVNSQGICDITVSNQGIEDSLIKLHNYCSSDEICAYYFNQRSNTINFTTFELLALPIFSNSDNNLNYVIDSLCSLGSVEDIIKYLWVRELVYKRSTNIIYCGPSQTLKINSDSSVNCICSPDSDCEDAQADDSLLITLLVILIVCTCVLFVMFVCNNQYFMRYTDLNK